MSEEIIEENIIDEPIANDNVINDTPKRKRGRPKKDVDTTKQPKPKRKCTPAQLEALARGRSMNKRFHPKDSD